MIPFGIITNSLAILIGGVLGWLLRAHIPERIKENFPLFFSFCAFAIGINAIVKVESISIVLISLLIGTFLGELFQIDNYLKKSAFRIVNSISKRNKFNYNAVNEKTIKRIDIDSIVVLVSIFCFSGTGIFGALNEGMNGDGSILLAKASLDFFASFLFASSLGIIVAFLALPQLLLFIALFIIALFIRPYLNVFIINNFIALGGIITLMVGFILLKIKPLKILNTLPALIIVLLLSYIVS